MFDLVSYSIKCDKLKLGEKKQVILIADLHNYFRNKNKAKSLVSYIKTRNPHHIVIAGDIIQGKKWESEKVLSSLKSFLNDLSSVAPVFMCLGNHDLVGQNDNRINNFKSLKVEGKVYPLTNDIITYDGFDIIGYNPKREVYNLGLQEHGIAHDMFIKDFMEHGVKILNSKNIIEFVGHSPYLFAVSENSIGLEELNKVDSFLVGHMHNGYKRSSTVKNNPDKYLDYGFVERSYSYNKDGKLCKFNPLFFSKTPLCRGVVYIDKNSKVKIIELRNNHFYMNNKPILESEALKIIKKNNYHPMVITGGIRKFFGFSLFGDKPEITEVIYENN